MFPSNPWVPYRLERLDLSYNLIPVLTFDITFGTKKLKHLNLSHNSINEVRKFVIGNLTALEVLDLSNNKLTNLNDPEAPFDLPENITNLYLQNNEIFRIDYEKIVQLKNLKEVNFENNELLHLNKSLIDAVKRNVSVRFEGNPLTCNCEIRSLKHFVTEQPSPLEQYSNLVCKHPKRVAEMTLEEIDDRQLTCDEVEMAEIGSKLTHDYEPLPDLRFREIFLWVFTRIKKYQRLCSKYLHAPLQSINFPSFILCSILLLALFSFHLPFPSPHQRFICLLCSTKS